ncbi:hypothetical protein L873DRAFT_1925421 [Choiromyces venosus 120613-1]|uniref:DDE-1 domain-containing protein n=1 Tax=Choiromyces venosus 120613-1 TaxID=1336337 RepID=A0A3N4JG89_9PEZI|nr:hypothetical protein L873DRAFT_1925421 [Choiromyces venosus 120613-1]
MEVALSQLLSSKWKSLLWNGFTESEVFQKIFYLAVYIMDELTRKWHKHTLRSTTAYKAQRAHRLLLFDGHSSHINAAFLEFCVSHNIIPYCLPPHTTHRLQPLDVSVFGPYKH